MTQTTDIKLTRSEFDALTRVDLFTFIQRVQSELNPTDTFLENWHIELMASELTKIWKGEQSRTIFNLPPRNLKSICISIAFVAWVLGKDPTRRFMVVSYGLDLAEKLARDTRQVMMSSWYKTLFPGTRLSSSRTASLDFETTANGGRMGRSRGGPITGRGAHYIIVDDPLKADEAMSEGARKAANDFVSTTLITRDDNKPHGRFIVAMQRLHEDDLSGYLLRTGQWRHICLPAIAPAREVWEYETLAGYITNTREAGEALHPEREPLDVLAALKADQGEYHFTAQYQQNPAPMSGNLIPIDLFKRYEPHTLPAEFELTLFSVDTASKAKERSDFTVITHWGRLGRRVYLLNVWRLKMTYFQLKSRLNTLRQNHQPMHILIEDTTSGPGLIDEFHNEGIYGLVAIAPKSDKPTRVMQANILIEGGDVYIPSSATWLMDYLKELAAFPHSRFDDQVDSTSQALNWIRERMHEPGILKFYRADLKKMQLGDQPEVPSVWMRPPHGMNHAGGIGGRQYTVDWNTGLMHMLASDAEHFRRIGWELADGPAPNTE